MKRIRLRLTGCDVDVRNANVRPDSNLETGDIDLRDATITLRVMSARWLATEEQPNEPMPLHQAWEATHACFWCGLREAFWTAIQRCPGHAVGDPLPEYTK